MLGSHLATPYLFPQMEAELRPKPFKLKRKPRAPKIQDLEPPDSCLQPTDLSTAKCHGVVHGEGVLVTQLQHIWALVKLGSYGKGIFSRSVPCHHHIPSPAEVKPSPRKRKVPGTSSEEIEMSWKKRVKLHLQWKTEDDSIADETETNEPTTSIGTKPEEPNGGSNNYTDFIRRLKEIKDNDPYHMEEYLRLGAEEAFYLAAEVKVLNVTNTESEILTNNQLWVLFSQLRSLFCYRYAAYVHYRAGNWVPKSGLRFGVDFLLYKESPLTYHSSFAVVVREGGMVEGEHNSITWKDVIALGRVNESAGKELLICHVTKPQGTTEEMLHKPCCVESMGISDVIVKRWVPEKDREL